MRSPWGLVTTSVWTTRLAERPLRLLMTHSKSIVPSCVRSAFSRRSVTKLLYTEFAISSCRCACPSSRLSMP